MNLNFSIVIPTYNRPAPLARCLDAISRLEYPASALEVVVVDDGSSTPLQDTIHAFRDRLNIQLLRQDNQGPAAARNFGVSRASHDFIAFTDDDCQPDGKWLQQFAQQLEQTPDAMVGGHTINSLEDDIYAEASQLILDVVYDHYNADRHKARFFSNNNFALSKALFGAMGGLDSNFRTSEDRDFCERWLLGGRQMIYLPQAVINHAHHLSFKAFCRQHFHYGRGAFSYRSTRGASTSGQQPAELGIHQNPRYWFRALSQRPGLWRQMKLSCALFIWRLADTSGYFWERFRSGAGKT